MRTLLVGLVALASAVLPRLSMEPSTEDVTVVVPFVGCPSDGQTGPAPAPDAESVSLHLDSGVAACTAVYRTEHGPAVLGPRGWTCVGRYGSGQTGVDVTPDPSDPSAKIEGFGIYATTMNGDTSGRFAVAQIVARVFPVERAFVDRIMAEGFLPAQEFPAGPFPTDRLAYRSDRIVEFQTPAMAHGLGTLFRFAPDADPIRGITILTSEHDVRHVAIRLPQDMTDVVPFIIREFQQAPVD
jgi:hypothetical protein